MTEEEIEDLIHELEKVFGYVDTNEGKDEFLLRLKAGIKGYKKLLEMWDLYQIPFKNIEDEREIFKIIKNAKLFLGEK